MYINEICIMNYAALWHNTQKSKKEFNFFRSLPLSCFLSCSRLSMYRRNAKWAICMRVWVETTTEKKYPLLRLDCFVSRINFLYVLLRQWILFFFFVCCVVFLTENYKQLFPLIPSFSLAVCNSSDLAYHKTTWFTFFRISIS